MMQRSHLQIYVTNTYFLSATDNKGEHYTCLFNGVSKEYAFKNRLGLSLEPEKDRNVTGLQHIGVAKLILKSLENGNVGPARIFDNSTINDYGIFELPERGLDKIFLLHNIVGLE